MKPSRVLLSSVLALLACGPTPSPSGPPAYADSFETQCGDLPCGWTQASGTSGQAAYVDTALPGEHGIALRGSGVSVRGPAADAPIDATLLFDSMQALLLARCDSGGSLTVSVGIVEVDSTGTPTGRTDTLVGRGAPPSEWSTRTRITLTGGNAFLDGGFGSGEVSSARPHASASASSR